MARSKSPSASTDSGKSDLVKLWLLRILVPLNGHQEFITNLGPANKQLADLLGLKIPLELVYEAQDIRTARASLNRLHISAEKKCAHAAVPQALADNVHRLADLMNLSPVDCRILEFVVMLHSDQLLDETADCLGNLSANQVYRALSTILALPEVDIRASLSVKGTLNQSGIVSIDRAKPYRLRAKIDLLSGHFAESMLIPEEDPISLLRDSVFPSAPSELNWQDYEHLGHSLTLLHTYLRHVKQTGRHGVNVLIHGAPGTGKTQLVRMLAKELSSELFEIASEDSDGDPVDSERRLQAYRAAQRFFASRQALLLFDEAEEIFNDHGGFVTFRSFARQNKAWVNRALEENSTPTLWLSNSVDGMDPAFIRRFDMVIELKSPPRKQREKIIQTACGSMLTPSALVRLSETDTITPAIVTRAASVVNAIRTELPGEQASSAIEYLVNSTLEAQGHAGLKAANAMPDYYDVSFINSDIDLEKVAEGLASAKEGRVCLYGPPGTGKTGFGRWLASKLDLPLHISRASDLFSKYVGGTERNIARAFQQANDMRAILLLDEVDSFLRERGHANHSWEVTQVNEMLAQMETYSGILIASTNLMDDLDQAAMRRFDFKLKFDYLKPDQAWRLFERLCQSHGSGTPDNSVKAAFEGLVSLTPGDFATVARQNRLRPARSPMDVFERLQQECKLKKAGGRAKIGFLH